MNILTELKKELGYANVTNQYIELATRTFQMDHGKESLQERARLVGLCVSEIPEDYTTRIAKGYITGVHSCVEHFLLEYRMLTGSPAHGHEYKADDDENRMIWTLNICYDNHIPQDVKLLYYVCNYYRLVRNEIVHSGNGSNELRQTKSQLNNIDEELVKSGVCGRLKAPNDLKDLSFDDQVLFSRAARTLCERIYKDSKYDWDSVLAHHRNAISSFIRANDSEGKKQARITNFLSQIYPINTNDQFFIDSLHRFMM